jgi:4-alpha-glucanotransferase
MISFRPKGWHMKFERSSGILLHPTSLPSPYGIGDLGPTAFQWIDFLERSRCSLWQVLPLGPTGYGDSPYQSFSSFAGNPYLVSPQQLLQEGLLQPVDLEVKPDFPDEKVDYGRVIPWKIALLRRAYERFTQANQRELEQEFERFQERQALWLEDFALFMALKDRHGGKPWPKWEAPLRDRDPAALQEARRVHAEAIRRQKFRQFLFFRQWKTLREYANQRGIRIIGDVPIFVAHDSADVWAHTELYYLDKEGNPTFVAGVPPDYFSPTGQLWGNPLYRWDIHARNGYQWWLARLQAVLQLVDIIRLDHFRGFAGYWEVPGGEETAEKGRWAPGPGEDFFANIKQGLGELPLIAEDLGEITPDVIELRENFNLPGMKILQFGFEGDKDFLPHNYLQNCVAYTGTHDNDTTRGWYQSMPESIRDFCRRYLGSHEQDVVWEMIRAIWVSVAVFAIAPMQDFFDLGSQARMNFPGRPSGNWTWRMPEGSLKGYLAKRIKGYNSLYARGLEEVQEPESP